MVKCGDGSVCNDDGSGMMIAVLAMAVMMMLTVGADEGAWECGRGGVSDRDIMRLDVLVALSLMVIVMG